jgi:hypothetical protein
VLKAAIQMRDVETMQAVLIRTVEGYQTDADAARSEGAPRGVWSPSSRTLH